MGAGKEGEIMKYFELNKKTKQGICDAKRCGEPSYFVATDGTKLCKGHYSILTHEETIKFNEPAQPEESDEQKALAVVEPAAEEANKLLAAFENYTIEDDEGATFVADALKQAHEQYKELETKRKAITKHLVEAKREIDGMFKPATKALDDFKKLLKGKIQERHERLEAARLEALETNDIGQALANPAPQAPTGTSVRKTWVFEVEDPAKVPREFLTVDDVKVRQAMEAQGPENTTIPGIKIYQESKIVMGRS